MNQQILDEIQALKQQILPNETVILFGSQARGDAHEDSDWDLLIILDKKEKVTSEEDTTYGYPFDKIGWKFGVAINTLLYSTEDWEKRKITPYKLNYRQI